MTCSIAGLIGRRSGIPEWTPGAAFLEFFGSEALKGSHRLERFGPNPIYVRIVGDLPGRVDPEPARSLSESRPDVDVRRVDELGKGCGIYLMTRPQFHVAPALARALEQANRVLQQRTEKKADVDVIFERIDVAKGRVADASRRTRHPEGAFGTSIVSVTRRVPPWRTPDVVVGRAVGLSSGRRLFRPRAWRSERFVPSPVDDHPGREVRG